MGNNKNTVLINIEKLYSDLHEAEKKVAKKILDDPSKVLAMNISELSELCEVSDATVVRTAQHLGYKGYHQMRLMLSKEQSFSLNDVDTIIKDPIDYYLKNELYYLNHITDNFNKDNFKQLIDLIKASEDIIIVGLGNALPIALDLEYRLNRLSYRSFSSSVFERTMNYINNSSENSLVIAVSKSGLSTRILDAINLGKRKNMTIASVVGDLSSPVAKISDLNIYSGNIKRFMSDVQPGTESYIGEYLINDLLIINLSYLLKEENIDNMELEIDLSSDKL